MKCLDCYIIVIIVKEIICQVQYVFPNTESK